MNKRLLVTGGSGFVAGSVIAQGWDDWEIHALSRNEAPTRHDGLVWHRLDVLDAAQLGQAFNRIKPHAVIHAAAVADIDECQSHRDLAERLNVGVTRELAHPCARGGAKLVFLSTDTVFDGRRGNYREEDLPEPINNYAETKVAAERVVAAIDGEWVIARLSLVVGLPVLGTGNSFLAKMVRRLEEGHRQGMPPEEIRTPIDVVTLGRALLELAGSDLGGYFHLAGNDVLNRLEMGRRIAERLGYPADRVIPADAGEMPGRAPRPRDVSLSNAKARAKLVTPMRTLDEGLDLVLSVRSETES